MKTLPRRPLQSRRSYSPQSTSPRSCPVCSAPDMRFERFATHLIADHWWETENVVRYWNGMR